MPDGPPAAGATYFGHDPLWPRHLFWPRSHRLWPRSILGIFEGDEGEERGRAREWEGPKGERGAEGVEAQTQKKCGGPNSGGPKFGSSKGGGPDGWGPKISRFFSFSRSHVQSFLPSLKVFSWNFGDARLGSLVVV